MDKKPLSDRVLISKEDVLFKVEHYSVAHFIRVFLLKVSANEFLHVTFFFHKVFIKIIFLLVSHEICFHTPGTSVSNWCFGGCIFELLAQTRYKPY